MDFERELLLIFVHQYHHIIIVKKLVCTPNDHCYKKKEVFRNCGKKKTVAFISPTFYLVMAEELLLLGALFEHANRADEARKDAESVNWVVPCTKCPARLQRMKGHEAYNTSENSSILCDGCRAKVPAKKTIFHCPKQMNLFHLNGFDYCLDCADKHRDKSQEVHQSPPQQRQQSSFGGYNNNNNNNNDANNNNGNNQLRQDISEKERFVIYIMYCIHADK